MPAAIAWPTDMSRHCWTTTPLPRPLPSVACAAGAAPAKARRAIVEPIRNSVSYTHLTLPTNREG